ncbi:nucleoid-associated protein [Mycobacterium montefiorense]|uniref:nucleoid-associated protein n=1 Tax=Mycobacterium montefiorense TaxID=154654 RepID=UPI00140289C8|nr:nucleoid-associated protein [Mycobacterium montefiorense]
MSAFKAGVFKPVEVIMHAVPKGKASSGGADELLYSEAPIALTADDRAFIQRRLRQSLGGYARPVDEDASIGSEVPDKLRELLASSENFVGHSREFARLLHLHQKPVSPGGLVMTVIGDVGGARCVVVAKMEHQEGMRVEQTTNEQGQRTFKAEHLRDLILGDGTRVFKVGVFVASAKGDLDGHVVDDQQRFGGVADYFIAFLGCRFRQQADVQTETFLKLAQQFIAERSRDDPEKNAVYEIALLADLQSSSDTIQPEKFAADHLREDDQDLFLERIQDEGLPIKSFVKDTTLIKNNIRRMRIRTERGADVFAPPDMFSDGSLTVQNGDGVDSVITLRDKVKQMGGASGKRTG